ncbi:MAG TPA: SEC-C metal-binding domain-containing protein [Mycobacteriales bacterium]|nr:SEC-C metal-binding domain-containing protein [Mycobacteriales bacterium]
MSERGIGRISVVPGTAAGLAGFAERTGGDPLDSAVRQAYVDELVSQGSTVAWPPPRNSRCWCGSAAKYKRCCGSPATR